MPRLRLPVSGFLPQTGFVEDLLRETIALLPTIPDSAQRKRVIAALEPFRRNIVPSALGIEEVNNFLNRELGHADPFAAADIILNAAYVFDLNYATDVIRYHADEYIAERIQTIDSES